MSKGSETIGVGARRLSVAVTGCLVAFLELWTDAPRAQLAAPGTSGVAMGHLHLASKDVDAGRKFWAAMGGVLVQNGALS